MKAMKACGYIGMAALLFVSQGCRRQDNLVREIRVVGASSVADSNAIVRAVLTLPGINKKRESACQLNLSNGVLRVRYDSMQVALKNIEHVIADAGFDANEIAADPAAKKNRLAGEQ